VGWTIASHPILSYSIQSSPIPYALFPNSCTMNQYWGRYEGILIPSLAGDAYAIYSSGWAAPVPGSNTTHWPSSNDDTLRYTSGVGETVDIKFYGDPFLWSRVDVLLNLAQCPPGSAIGVLAWMHPYNYRIPGFNRGALYKVQVFIDGVPYPVVEVQDDSPSDESSAPRSRLLFDSGLLTLGTHTLTIKNLLGCSQLPLVLHSFQIVSTGEIHPHLLYVYVPTIPNDCVQLTMYLVQSMGPSRANLPRPSGIILLSFRLARLELLSLKHLEFLQWLPLCCSPRLSSQDTRTTWLPSTRRPRRDLPLALASCLPSPFPLSSSSSSASSRIAKHLRRRPTPTILVTSSASPRGLLGRAMMIRWEKPRLRIQMGSPSIGYSEHKSNESDFIVVKKPSCFWNARGDPEQRSMWCVSRAPPWGVLLTGLWPWIPFTTYGEHTL